MGWIADLMRRITVGDVKALEPQIVELDEPLLVMGMAVDTDSRSVYRDVPKLGQAYERYKAEHGIAHRREPWAYVAVGSHYDPQAKTFRYLMGDVVTRLDVVPEELEGFEIPTGTYAVFPVRPRVRWGWGAAITQVKVHAYEQWLPASGYRAAGGAVDDFEYHDERSTRRDDPEIDLYIAIKPV